MHYKRSLDLYVIAEDSRARGYGEPHVSIHFPPLRPRSQTQDCVQYLRRLARVYYKR